MKANEFMSVMLKALGILMLIWSLGVLANQVINVISALSTEYGRPGMAILHLFADCIYLIGAIGMIVGSKFVANKIDKIEVKGDSESAKE